MPSAVIGYETYFCPQQIKSKIKDVGGAARAPLYLVLSLTLGTTRTHSRFWNDDSSHSVFVKVNWNER